MTDSRTVIFSLYLSGPPFTLVGRTGARRQAVDALVRRFARHETLVVPAACLAFALGGALDNMKEEIIALVPVALLLTRRLGYPAVTAVAMSLGAAAVGAAFSPINPFQVGIAQQLAQIPLLSGSLFRIAFLALAVAAWIWGTMRPARRARAEPAARARDRPEPLGRREIAVLLLVLTSFAVLVWGVLRHRWGFDERPPPFCAMVVGAGLGV